MIASIFALSLSVTGCTAPAAVESQAQVIGRARTVAGQSTQYCEYFIREQDRWRVLYFSSNGKKIAEKILRSAAGRAALETESRPTVVQEDFRHGELREATKSADGWLLGYRPTFDGKLQEKRVPARKVDVVDAGFDAFVRKNYTALVAGESIDFGFASPLHGRVIGLRARSVACESGSQSLCVDVELASGFLRWLAGAKIYLEYQGPATVKQAEGGSEGASPAQETKPRLARFVGTVNLLNDEGDSQVLDIEYFYPNGLKEPH